MRSNKREGTKPCHIVSARSGEDGYCLGQKAVEEKNNEITAIPKALESIEIKGQAVTPLMRWGRRRQSLKRYEGDVDYVLAAKGN